MIRLFTVNYGDPSRLGDLWKSLQAYPPAGHWTWTIIDNGSGKVVQQTLQKTYGKHEAITLEFLPQNKGFGAAHNAFVKGDKDDVLCFINPDIQITKTTWEILHLPVEMGYVRVPILQTEKGKILPNIRQFPTLLSILKRRVFQHQDTKIKSHQVSGGNIYNTGEGLWGQASFWCMSHKTWQMVGGFDERFFLFFEDTDWCRRLLRKGGRITQIPTAVAIHSEHRLSGNGLNLWKKTLWIHIHSAYKYWCKWKRINIKANE